MKENLIDKLKNFKKNIKNKDIETLKRLKVKCDDSYYNSDKSLISDEEYDILKEFIKKKDPSFKETVGSKIRDTDNRVTLPYWLGSIDKIKIDENSQLDRWIKKNESKEYIVEDKLDGVSCLLISKNNEIKLYTRGDGKVGADISHLSKYIKLPDDNLKKYKYEIAIRGELIIKKKIFKDKYEKEFANPRNMVSGIIGSKSYKERINDIEFIAYEILNNTIKPSEQLLILKKIGFNIINYKISSEINFQILKEELTYMKINSDYEIDGIIIQSNLKYEKNNNGNPKYAFAFKMLFENNLIETEVEDIEWNTSKWGILKPRIKIKQILLGGVTINYTTGFNAKFIYNNNINKGSIVLVTRSGDVIPYIIKVIKCSDEPKMPKIKYKWNESMIDIIIDKDEIKENNEMKIKIIVSFFEKLNIKYVSDKTIEKIYNNGYDNIIKIISITKDDLLKIDGIKETLATKICNNIKNSLQNISIPLLLGSSCIFGFGVGSKKIESLFETIPDILYIYKNIEETELIEKINKIEGFSSKTTKKIIENLENADNFIKQIKPFVTFKSNEKKEIKDSLLNSFTICFSGFRDKELGNNIINNGGTFSETFTKNVNLLIVKDINDNSSKIKNARKNNIQIIEKNEFIKKYL